MGMREILRVECDTCGATVEVFGTSHPLGIPGAEGWKETGHDEHICPECIKRRGLQSR